jgi:hypothetical protein
MQDRAVGDRLDSRLPMLGSGNTWNGEMNLCGGRTR